MSLKRQLNTPEKPNPNTKMGKSNKFEVLRDEAEDSPAPSAKKPDESPMKQQVDKELADTKNSAANVRRGLTLTFDEQEGDADSPPRWFSKFTSMLDQRFTNLEHYMEMLVVEKVEKINEKVKANEETISACTIQLDEVVREVNKLKAENEVLVSKLDDLENRSRRNNLVFHGIPESRGENTQKLVENLFHDFVGVQPSSDVPKISIERCHRTPTVVRADSQAAKSPRVIHVAFSTYAGKEFVRKACIAKFKQNTYQGHKIYVSEDFSKRVAELRRGKLDQLKNLKREGKKAFFMYPARLAFRDAAGKLHVVG